MDNSGLNISNCPEDIRVRIDRARVQPDGSILHVREVVLHILDQHLPPLSPDTEKIIGRVEAARAGKSVSVMDAINQAAEGT